MKYRHGVCGAALLRRHQDPVQRPGIDVVVEQLEALEEPLAEAEAAAGARQGLCGCTIS